ncbi:hypothetical protein BH20ACT24_BH20ACT24_16680 [soil metagenome]
MERWSEARTFQDPQSASEALDQARSVGFDRDLLDLLNPAVIVTDVFGAITQWNRHAEALYGWTREEVLGRNVRELVFEGQDADAAEAILATLAAGGTWEGEFDVRRKDGTAVRVVVSDAPVHDENGILVGFVGVSFDLSRRERAERGMAAFAGVARVLPDAPPLAEAIPRIIRAVCEALDWDLGVLWAWDADAGSLRCAEMWRRASPSVSRFEDISRRSRLEPDAGPPGGVWLSGEPRWIREVGDELDSPRARAAVAEGLQSGLAFPVRLRTETFGVFEFFTTGRLEPDTELLAVTVGLGTMIGQYIERRRAEEAAADSDARKSAVLESALDAIVIMDAGGRIAEFNPAAERIFGFRQGDVIGKEMASVIVPPSLRESHRRGLHRYLATGQSRLLGRRLELTGYRADGTEFPVELAITRVDVAGPPLFTGYIRDITERRRAEDDRHRAQQGLALLAEASDVLTASLDQEAMLSSIARLVVPRLATWCAIHVRSEDGAILASAAVHADPEKQPALDELIRCAMDPRTESAVARVLRTGQAAFHPEVNDRTFSVGDYSRGDAALVLEALEASSVMVLPLTARSKTLGAITFARSETAPPFDHRDLALAHDLAHRAATAMDNARIYRERDYIARTLQQSLLPPKLPTVPGLTLAARYRPAGEGNEVGGDFYDIFQTASNVWTVAIGDVCGKGPEAAALTGLARHTLRAAAMRQSRPTRILATLNQALLDQGGAQRFCTVCCARIKRTSDGVRVTVSSGGHPLPLLLRGDGTLQRLGASGTLLGVFPDPDLTDESLDLAPGDAVIFYTDGVTEERAAGVVFSEARLESIVRSCAGVGASVIAERIERAVLDFQPDPAKDDVAVLVLQVPREA